MRGQDGVLSTRVPREACLRDGEALIRLRGSRKAAATSEIIIYLVCHSDNAVVRERMGFSVADDEHCSRYCFGINTIESLGSVVVA